MTTEEIWFGRHKGKELREIPSGYLRWMVENFDPKPVRKDTRGLTRKEIQAMEDRMRNLIRSAAKELNRRGESGIVIGVQPDHQD